MGSLVEHVSLAGGSTRALAGRSYVAVALALAPFQPWQPASWHGAPRWRSRYAQTVGALGQSFATS